MNYICHKCHTSFYIVPDPRYLKKPNAPYRFGNWWCQNCKQTFEIKKDFNGNLICEEKDIFDF